MKKLMAIKKISTFSLIFICTLWLGQAYAIGLAGTIKDQNGEPVAGVMVKVTSASAAALVTKVFSDVKGEYVVPNLGKNVGFNSIYVETFRLGYEQTKPQEKALGILLPPIKKDMAQVNFVLKPITNIATQVPPSAWLASAPESPAKHLTVVTCTTCHGFPTDQIKAIATALKDQDEASREQVWRAMVRSMRTVVFSVLKREHSPPMTQEQLAEVAKPENSFIGETDENIIGPWLAKYMPTSFDYYDIGDKSKFSGIPLGVTKKTIIREFDFDAASHVRESVVINGEYWICDINRNRIGKIDVGTGTRKWYDVPTPLAAPHTMVPDKKGNIWVTLTGGTDKAVAMFNPKAETWRIYGNFPKGIIAHDFSQGANYLMEFDKDNINWMTVISNNKVIGFNRDTGEVTPFYDLPSVSGESEFRTGAYGGGMTSDKNFWFAQQNGVMGRFNTELRKVDFQISYGEGAGPHRMVVDKNDIIYLTLQGSGQVSIIDGRKLKEIKRVALPDTASAPYAVALDTRRNALWFATANNDSLFKYSIKSGAFTEYPVNIKGLHIRMIAVDDKTGDLFVTSSPLPNKEPEMRRFFLYHPGDM